MILPRPAATLRFTATLAAATISLSALAAGHKVTSAADLAAAASSAQPGDVLIMSDGTWEDQTIVFRSRGTADNPITLRAATPGKVILSGRSSLFIDGRHVVVRGLHLVNGQLPGDGVKLSGHGNRLTECAIIGGTCKFFVHIFGTSNRVDHCYLADKTNDHPTVQVEVEGRPNYHRIDHNHFGPRPPLGRNGGETIRVGYSHQSMTNSRTVVENNLFDRCDGEIEIVSNKSCENVYRSNTFFDCAGMLTLRHGNRCVVDGNIFLGRHKRGSGGIRVIGEDHVVTNNYIEGVALGGIWITAGIPGSELRGYFQARNCRIEFNTIADSTGPCLELDAGMGTARRTLRPENITVSRNLFAPGNRGSVTKGTEGAGWQWHDNFSLESRPEQPGIRFIDAALSRDANGTYRLPPNVQPAAGASPQRPLSPNDVGPAWLDRSRR